MKIAFLTILVVNLIVVGGYWTIRFMAWQTHALSHHFGFKHECPMEDFKISMMIFWIETMGAILSVVAIFAVKSFVSTIYRKLDQRFPEKGR